jgi:hypothetical protein
MDTKKFNNIFFIFVSFIILIAIFYLYQKHLVGNDSTMSEWFINYQGGFTRRGLIGEICFKIADLFNLKLRFVIFIFQSVIITIYLILIYQFIKDLPKNILTVIAIFSPLFLLYPVAEIEVLARKEIFIFIGFIIFLNLSNVKVNNNYSFFYIFIVFPILCLIWEPVIFFTPFIIYVFLIKNNQDSLTKISIKILIALSTSIAVCIYIILNLLTPEEHTIMSNSLMDRFGEICYMSCSLLTSKGTITNQFNDVYNLLKIHNGPTALFRYSLIILIGFLPLLILLYYSRLKSKILLLNVFKKLHIHLIILLLPTIIMFASMTDWGRIVNMMYVFSILLSLYLIKNDLINTNDKVLYFDNFFRINKKIFITIFIVFAFGWNPKTSILGDVATNSLYKIIYNTSKKVFNFDSIRLFENSVIIKLHKKYIE